MGDDMRTSAAGFQDPAGIAAGKRGGEKQDEDDEVSETILESGF